MFSIHKTVGVTTFAIALARILWALREVRPVPLHPERRSETLLAGVVHWVLYISLVAVPLSGWIHHASVTGFAPILWPLGQGLPFVPQSAVVASVAASLHWVFTKLLIAAVLLHIAGALKHHLLDRDSTLRRMSRGVPAPMHPEPHTASVWPIVMALGLYTTGAGVAWALAPKTDLAGLDASTTTATQLATAGNWEVTQGTLVLTVRQLGQDVTGSFATWAADITFDETPVGGRNGTVTVTIDTASLTLGSVSGQATGKDFLDAATFPQAIFRADVTPDGTGYVATGTLFLKGAEVPVTLPFTLVVNGQTATMQGTTTLDRRTFGIGVSYGDEASVGFGVDITVDLTATRTN